MGSIMTSLLNSANAMRVYEGALEVTENNITNANTPGYAKQVANLQARPFDLSTGESGGVALNGAQSSRDQFAEQAVRNQQTAVNFYQQKASDLSPLENYFSTSNTSGIGPDMSSLFAAFSQLSVNPNDTVSRQAVLNQATTVAQDFNQAANGLLSQGSNVDQGTRGAIDNINQLAQTIAQLNQQNRVDPQGGINAGVDAQMNAALEQLSQLVNYTALQQPDGTVSVYVGGQTPLVVSNQVYAIQGDFTAPQTAVLSSTGADITGEMTGGQLSALLDDKNNILPSYINKLNSLAQSFADQVNTTLGQRNRRKRRGAGYGPLHLRRYNRRSADALGESDDTGSDCRRTAGIARGQRERTPSGSAGQRKGRQRVHLRATLRQSGRTDRKRSFGRAK